MHHIHFILFAALLAIPERSFPMQHVAVQKQVAQGQAMVQQSVTSCTWPIITALVTAEQNQSIGPDLWWLVTNEQQGRFLRLFTQFRHLAGRFPEIVSMCSRSIPAINRFLAEKGFPEVQLEDNLGPGGVGVASVLKLFVQWLVPGKQSTVHANGSAYPAAKLETAFRLLRVPGHEHLIVEIRTVSDDQVFLTMMDCPEDLDARAMLLSSSINQQGETEHVYSAVLFPMVDLDQKVDISFLCGMAATGRDGHPVIIAQALQQTRLQMNEIGAKVESTVAVSMMMGMVLEWKDYIINQPFLMWIQRPGCELPLFVGWLAPDCWKNPGEIK